MYALWKTQGVTVEPRRADVRFGAASESGALCISLVSDKPWEGRLIVDRERHALNDAVSGGKRMLTGKELVDGVAVSLKAGEEMRLIVKPAGKK